MPVDYIKYIRSMVGHNEIISVGLAVVIFNERGEVLLEKRSDNGLWCVPGGSLDIGETAIEGAKREVYEETGIILDRLELIGIASGPDQLIVYPNGDKTYYLDLEFRSEIRHQNPTKNDGESTEIKWLKIDNLPDEHEFLRGQLKMIKNAIDFDGKVTVS